MSTFYCAKLNTLWVLTLATPSLQSKKEVMPLAPINGEGDQSTWPQEKWLTVLCHPFLVASAFALEILAFCNVGVFFIQSDDV